MKLFKRLSMICVSGLTLATLLSGCARTNFDLAIDKENNVEISMLAAVSTSEDNEYGAMMGLSELDKDSVKQMIDADTKKQYKKNGIKVKTYQEDDYIGIKLIHEPVPMEDLSEAFDDFSAKSSDSDTDWEFEKKGSTYIVEIPVETTMQSSADISGMDMGLDDSLEEMKDELEDLDGYMTFTVHLPSKAGKNNATEVLDGGKTLIWDLTDFDDDEIHFEYKLADNTILFIIIGVVAIAVVLFLVFMAIKNKRQGARIPELNSRADYGSENPVFTHITQETTASVPYETIQKTCPNCQNPELNIIDRTDEYRVCQCPKCGKKYHLK